jgi:hypothetical protein
MEFTQQAVREGGKEFKRKCVEAQKIIKLTVR